MVARSVPCCLRATRRLLGSCDPRRPAGRRDFAILTVLARLGLRAGEVAALRLADIDWRAGELAVHGKAGRQGRLPSTNVSPAPNQAR